MGSLIVARRLNEIIDIGGNIEIQIVRISPETVRLKIMAPDSVTILRRELTLANREKKEQSK